jgi:hypothetical protein
MKNTKHIFFLNRCINPICKTPDKEYSWDLDEFKKYPYSLEKQMNVCLCGDCFDDFILSNEKARKFYTKLKKQVEQVIEGIGYC